MSSQHAKYWDLSAPVESGMIVCTLGESDCVVMLAVEAGMRGAAKQGIATTPPFARPSSGIVREPDVWLRYVVEVLYSVEVVAAGKRRKNTRTSVAEATVER